MSKLDEIIQIKTGSVTGMDDYVVIRALLATKQEQDKAWPYFVDRFDEWMATDERTLYDLFMEVKLKLRRIEFELDEESIEDVILFLQINRISPYLIYDVIHVNFFDEEKMQKRFAGAFFRYCTDEEYKSAFLEHAGRVEFYDIDI
mgnify:CR=1 FL=1